MPAVVGYPMFYGAGRFNPLTSGLKICIVGDSGIQLNKSKGTAGFDYDLKEQLGDNVETARFPAEGAEVMTRYLRNKQSLDVVVAVWMLNELFDKANNLLRQYPPSIDHLAVALAAELKRFPHHV